MKPQPKEKELDELLADEAAQLEAEAQQEISYVVTYRDNADLSWKLDLPKDVEELMKLVEEKKKSAGEYKHIKNEPFSAPNLRFLGASAVLLAAAAPGFATLIYGSNHDDGVLNAMGFFGTFLGMALGMTWSYKLGDYMEQRSPKKAKFEEDKQKRIAEKKAENMLLDKKLSHYQKDYHLSDIVLVDDPELGYSLGDIRYNEREETTLHQYYHKLTRDRDAIDGRYWTQCEEYKLIDRAKIISVLRPSYESLSADDLRSLEEGTSVFCVPNDYKPKISGPGYGFFRNEKMPCGKPTGLIELRTLRTFQGPGEYWYSFEDVEKEEISMHLLTPVIKPRF